MQFRDRVVVVTGAASGIGRALCSEIGRAGGTLGLVDCNAPGLKQAEAELQAEGVRCAAATADVRDRVQLRTAVEVLSTQLGPVDIAIACAGLGGLSLVDDLRIEQLEQILQVNFLGVVYTMDAVLPTMLRRGIGQIVGIASLAAFRGLPFEGAYCASKAAVASYLESLRPALRRRGISVTTVYPGFVRTPLLDSLLAGSGARPPRGTMEAGAAARRIAISIARGQRVACFPFATAWLMRYSRVLPAFVYDWLMTRIALRIPLRY